MLRNIIISPVSSVKKLLRKYREVRFAKKLCKKSDYAFTTDYVSWLTPTWEKHLEGFRAKNDVKILEIGSFEGRSAIWFLENILTHPTSSITCVDIFPSRYERLFDHNIRFSGFSDKVLKMKGRSERIVVTLKEKSFDIVYIDGSHLAPNVLMDAMASWFLLKEGGIMIFDDYEWEPGKPPEERPQIAIDIFLRGLQHQVELLHKGYQVIVRKESA
jgi:predicted O-methyltransferase YrrM